MKIKETELNAFLESLSLESSFRVLDEATDKDHIEELAKKYNIPWPNPDISIFTSKYAFTEKANLNGCRLPTEEVEKALHTLAHKAVDFDHLRQRVVGHYLGAELKDGVIYADGIFFKSNFSEDYEVIKELMNNNNLKVSFEAWGNREKLEDGTYNLTNIHFAGGALLIDTKPAFPDAGVLELSKKRVLEMANVLTAPKNYIREETDMKKLEKARYYAWEIDSIARLMYEVKCPDCNKQGTLGLDMVNFKDNECEGECFACSAKCKVKFTPKAEKIEKSSAREIASIELLSSKNKTEDSSKDMNELEQLKAELASIKEQLAKKDEEIASLKAEIEKAKTDSEAQKEAFVAEKAEAIKIAKEQAVKVTERKATLGEEFAKDMSDEDILNDDKYEIAKLRKENAELKAKKEVEKANAQETAETLEKGSKKDKEEVKEFTKKQKAISKLAFESDEV
jgi:hypothetical protein